MTTGKDVQMFTADVKHTNMILFLQQSQSAHDFHHMWPIASGRGKS